MTFWVGFGVGVVAAVAAAALIFAVFVARIAKCLPYPPPEGWA